ncbi:MAG: hypothetical protein HQ500_01790 [Flavobacteriales bacterium]|nr:hypothetical protein [Flavobacteriales bacterium]
MYFFIVLFPVFVALPFRGQAQSEVNFHHHFQPERTYELVQKSISSNGLSYQGDPSFVAMMEASGVGLKQETADTALVAMEVTTGQMANDKEFPLEIHLLRSEGSTQGIRLPEGVRIYGSTTLLGMPRLDSLSDTGNGEEYEDALLVTMQGLFGQLKFPERQLVLGDTFTDIMPLDIPIAGFTMQLITKSHYTLIALSEEQATFDLVQSFTLDSDVSEFKAKASGLGTGELIYNIPNEFITTQASNMEMKMTMEFEAFSIHLDQGMQFVQNVNITQ